MNINNTLNLLLVGVLLLGCPQVNAQKTEKKKSQTYRDSVMEIHDNLEAVYKKLLMNAVILEPAPSSSCQPNEIVKKIDQLLKKDKGIHNNSTNYLVHFRDIRAMGPLFWNVDLPKVNKGGFKTEMDMLLSAFAKTQNYSDFVSQSTGDLGDLSKAERKRVRDTYLFFKNIFSKEERRHLGLGKEIKFDDCAAWVSANMKTTSFDYPNITYEIEISVDFDCNCSKGQKSLSVESGYFKYVATSKGVFSGSAITFGNPINPHIEIGRISCCPDIDKDDKSAAAPPKIEKKEGEVSQIQKTETVALTLDGKDSEDESKIETNSKNRSGDVFDYTWTGDGFTVTVGAGLPLGKEADFFSLNYGVELNYLFRISDTFSAGFGAGYTGFIGKEVNGFKTDAVGFIPVHAKAEYLLSEQIAAYGNLGYGIATDGGSGGVEVVAGAKYKVHRNIGIGLEYRSIFVEGGSFSSFGLAASIGIK